MIYVICGLIGAGKTTYARGNFEVYTDSDEIKSKTDQLKLTRFFHGMGKDVAHITTYPREEEMEYFKALPAGAVKYIWINTSERQCRKNILKRGRYCNMSHLEEAFQCNSEIVKMVQKSEIPFEFIDVFPTDERW